MRFIARASAAAAAALILCAAPAFATPAMPVQFDLSFDATFDDVLEAPFVGTGVFSLSNDPGDGVYLIDELDDPFLSISFLLPEATFTLDEMTDLSRLLVRISEEDGGRTVRFALDMSEVDGPAFIDSETLFMLTFATAWQPMYVVQPPMLAVGEGELPTPTGPLFLEGTYGPTPAVSAVPVPPAAAALVLGLAGLGALRRRRA